MFNAMKYTEELEKAGFNRKQAEVLMKCQIDMMDSHFATKSDISDLSLRIERLSQRVDTFEYKLDYKIQDAKKSLIISLGGLMVTLFGLGIAACGLFFNYFLG